MYIEIEERKSYMKVTITCSINDHSYETQFICEPTTKEYIIADEAYRIAILFASTQAIVKYGHPIDGHQLAEFLKDLDYNYTIQVNV